jgi:hypothetical protein
MPVMLKNLIFPLKNTPDFQSDILATMEFKKIKSGYDVIVTDKTREYIRDLLLRRFRGTEEDMIDFPEEFEALQKMGSNKRIFLVLISL